MGASMGSLGEPLLDVVSRDESEQQEMDIVEMGDDSNEIEVNGPLPYRMTHSPSGSMGFSSSSLSEPLLGDGGEEDDQMLEELVEDSSTEGIEVIGPLPYQMTPTPNGINGTPDSWL